jgi:murein L,D-transpeptidase YafK
MNFFSKISALLIIIFISSSSFADLTIDMIFIKKSDRMIHLLKNGNIIKTYNIALGFEPIGHKHKRGDGKTPEGLYYINKKLHNSDFHIALQISYPNKWDKRKAKINSNNPGGLIMIHGQSKNLELNTEDWTNGCIAVTNEEIEEINKLVELKTPVYISK